VEEGSFESTLCKNSCKVLLHYFTAMRKFAVRLEARGVRVRYVRIDAEGNAGSIAGELTRSVRELKPQRVVMTECGEWRLAEALRAGSILRSLDLHECYVGADGLAALAAALQGNTTLQVLRLSDNNLAEKSGLGSHELSAEEGLAALAALLAYNRTLRSVDLRYNGLDDAQQRALMLSKRETLQLDLI